MDTKKAAGIATKLVEVLSEPVSSAEVFSQKMQLANLLRDLTVALGFTDKQAYIESNSSGVVPKEKLRASMREIVDGILERDPQTLIIFANLGGDENGIAMAGRATEVKDLAVNGMLQLALAIAKSESGTGVEPDYNASLAAMIAQMTTPNDKVH